MKKWIRFNPDIMILIPLTLALFLSYCFDVSGCRKLCMLFGAVALACTAAYFIYNYEAERRRSMEKLAKAREERKRKMEEEMLEDYADYRRTRAERAEAYQTRKI